MSTAGPNSPSTTANDASTGTVAWTNPNNSQVSDNSYATASLGSTQSTQFLKCTGFNFSIPTNSIINGILVEIEASATGALLNSIVKLSKAGTIQNAENKGAIADTITTEQYYSFGSGSDLWSNTWLASDINNSGLGVFIALVGKTITNVSIDHVRITVTYTLTGLTPREYPRAVSRGIGRGIA